MHLYDEPTQLQCPNCKRWWKPGNIACAVLHMGKGCCHYGDKEVFSPEEKRDDSLRLDVTGTREIIPEYEEEDIW